MADARERIVEVLMRSWGTDDGDQDAYDGAMRDADALLASGAVVPVDELPLDSEGVVWPEGHLWRAHAPGECACDTETARVDRACVVTRAHLAEALRASVRVGGADGVRRG